MIVALMPPDAPSPSGGYATPGWGIDGLRIGDTVGRTPGAYGVFLSCYLTGYVGDSDVIHGATLSLTVSSILGINPLGPAWKSHAGLGPATLLFDMVKLCGCMGKRVSRWRRRWGCTCTSRTQFCKFMHTIWLGLTTL